MNYHEPQPHEQYDKHKAKSDSIVETLKELVIMNKIMHDGLSEAQAMIGARELKILRQDLEIQDLRNQLLMACSCRK
tara:strand:+ start:217 stop:447 length:231 start_codon:yes stop_codon:yes gene_type:complete